MTQAKHLLVLATMVALPATSLAADPVPAANAAKDPTYTVVKYPGTGTAEEQPTIGTAFFSFSVDCQQSAEAVRAAIAAVSDPVWQAIEEKVPKKDKAEEDFTETRGRFFGATGNIQEQPGVRFEAKMPHFDPSTGKAVAGELKVIDVCGKKQIKIEEAKNIGTVFSGSRVFGVRTDDLKWLEGKVLEVNTTTAGGGRDPNAVRGLGGRLDAASLRRVGFAGLPTAPEVPPDVEVIPGSIVYDVTKETRQKMLTETREEARAQAQASLDADTKSLKLTHKIALNLGEEGPPLVRAFVTEPVGRGQPPKARLITDYLMSFFLKATGLKNHEGAVSDYPVKGDATLDADYATLTVEFEVRCQTGQAEAATAMSAAGTVTATTVEKLRKFRTDNGPKDSTEKDRLEIELLQGPFPETPYMPVAWNQADPNFPVTQYLNTCTFAIVDAPPSGNVNDLPPTFRTIQLVTLRSSQFAKLLDFSEQLQNELDKSNTARDAVYVTTSDPVGSVTEATDRDLQRLARQDAIAQILAEGGPLATTLKANKYELAFFRSLEAKDAFSGKFEGAILANAEADIAPRDALAAEVVIGEDERRTIKMVQHYWFAYEVRSENYAE